jgi:hypothetical protein
MADKNINEMNREELRAALADYERSTHPAQKHVHRAPGMTAQDSEEAQETASKLYLDAIMRKDAGQLTPEDRAFLRSNIVAYKHGD